MKATAKPAGTIPADCYECTRCGRIVDHASSGRTMCFDCATIEADLADPARIAELDRRLDPVTRTHCAHGHDLSGGNGFHDSRGWVQCRECRREADRKRLARRRAS